MKTILVDLKKGVNPVRIDNNVVVKRISVVLPKGLKGMVSLQNADSFVPFLNAPLGEPIKNISNLYHQIEGTPTDILGYIKCDDTPAANAKAVISIM